MHGNTKLLFTPRELSLLYQELRKVFKGKKDKKFFKIENDPINGNMYSERNAVDAFVRRHAPRILKEYKEFINTLRKQEEEREKN